MSKYTHRTKKLSEFSPLVLPIGVAHEGSIDKTCKVKGLSAGARRNLSLLFERYKGKITSDRYHELVTVLLQDTVVQVGPFMAEDGRPLNTSILDGLSSIDREFLAWMGILKNYEGENRKHGVQLVAFKCHSCGKTEKVEFDPWILPCVDVDPASWDVEGQSVRYSCEFQGHQLLVMVPSGSIEKSLPDESDLHGRAMDALVKLVVQMGDKKFPLTMESLSKEHFLYQDQLNRAIRLDPNPGIDTVLQTECDCGETMEVVLSFIPFLFPGM